MPILKIKNLIKKYPISKKKDKVILNNLNLEVQNHDFISLIGPSGCGKSTLLRMVTGEEKPTSGEIYFNGKILNDISTEIGIVYQRYSLFTQFNIQKNITLGTHLRIKAGENRSKIKADFDEMVELFGVEDLLQKYPFQLSGGQQQRVSIIQALINHPKILFMDEAFGALDPFTKMQLKGFIDEYWKKHKTTIIFITHDLEDAITMGNRVVLLSQYYKKAPNEEGSKIVVDIKTPLKPTLNEKEKLINKLKLDGFNPNFMQNLEINF